MTESLKPITVLLGEDHTIVREGLRILLDAAGDIRVVGEASSGRQAVAMTRKLHPAVVVMDIAMPVLNGLEALRQIRREIPGTKVLILSAHSDDAYVRNAGALGAAGYLLKQASASTLVTAVREVAQGHAFFSPSIARRLQNLDEHPPGRRKSRETRGVGLSSREMEVLQLIAEGQANKNIASELGISIKTVEKHRQSVMEKLGIHDTAGLTRYAIEAGIIECSVQVTIL